MIHTVGQATIQDWVLLALAASFIINALLTSIQIFQSHRIDRLNKERIAMIAKLEMHSEPDAAEIED